MNNSPRFILKARHAGIAALAVAAAAVAPSPASAHSHRAKHVVSAPSATAQATATTAAATPSVTSVISIGGYVFYNLTYAEAVDAWVAAVAAAPAGYVPPTVYSVSVDTTVSGNVENGN